MITKQLNAVFTFIERQHLTVWLINKFVQYECHIIFISSWEAFVM